MNSYVSFSLLFVFVTCVSGFHVIPNSLHIPADEGKLWAVLVSGSHGFLNYRHQADVCHAYHVLKNHGIPEERIIVMMADDVAFSDENITPGVLVNTPHGFDVYRGVQKDYTGTAVTPENFMAVLRGDKKALKGIGSEKVLESESNDHVFVYFADHGAPGLLAFPESVLSAQDLNKTIHYMYDNKKYGKMVIYVEACESGSMFKNILPNNINVFATTSANSSEPSYACYWDKERLVFIGDTYSVNWIENSESAVMKNETLWQQYKKVRNETTKSHVQEFGDMEIAKMPLSEFHGRKKLYTVGLPKFKKDNVPSRDVPVETIKRKYMQSNSVDEQSKLLKKMNKMISNRLYLVKTVSQIVSKAVYTKTEETIILNNRYELRDFDCYEEVRKYFNTECFDLAKNPYALGSLSIFVNLCERKIPSSRTKLAMDIVCVHPPMYGIV